MKIIVAPLNWGIGHATRIIPIIKSLRKQGASVHLASDGAALSVLQSNFPDLEFTVLPAYNIRYKHESLWKNSFSLTTKMLKTIPKEKKVMNHLAKAIKADVILSDNRFGCYSDTTRNIFITHQLKVFVGGFANKAVNLVNQRLMNKFDEIWVPDYPFEPSLAGKLSHADTKFSVKYIGGLSRFEPLKPQEKQIDVLAILSGPEPQRTYLEHQIIEQFAASNLSATIVRGKPLDNNSIKHSKVNIINYATTEILYDLIAKSRVIISRSGYSTIMDYDALGLFAQVDQKIIFIPTPGQPEQIYLAEKMQSEGLALSVAQNKFGLEKALSDCAHLKAIKKLPNRSYLDPILESLLG